jgi:hypothetical protein
MTSKREHTGRSKHQDHGKHHIGLIEAQTDGAYTKEERFNSLQNRLGNRAVNQLLATLSSHTPSAVVYRQSISSNDLPLQKGSRGAAVSEVQQALLKAGYSLGKPGADGIFGRLTRRAIRHFQHDNQLPETKIVDQQTWNVLMNVPATKTATTPTPPAQAPSPSSPATSTASLNGKIPTVDLGPKQKGRAFMLDWESKHSEIAQDTTLRKAFLANLAKQLADIFGEKNLDQEQVLTRIEQAESAGKADEAEQLRVKLRIANEYAVVETLQVEKSKRYEVTKKTDPKTGKEKTSTYCNIYGYDVVTALGGYLPRVWWKSDALARIKKGEKVKPEYEKTVTELSANGLTEWMDKYGSQFGWRREADITAAQEAANQGKLIILLADNPRGPGHVNVLMPETKQHLAIRKDNKVTGPLQSQAGGKNFKLKAHRVHWWENLNKRQPGAAWIFEGNPSSPLLSPEQLGFHK